MTTRAEPLVEVTGLTKSYGTIRALRGVDVTFRKGEIHGLVGANGAGKSTLVRSLAGLEQPDEGRIVVRGEPTTIHDPAAAADLGFAFIHQELNLVDSFTGAQNILLGSHRGNGWKPRKLDGIPKRVREVAARVGIDFALDKPVSQLTAHQQRLIGIARALVRDSELIAMDEPTASLDADEVVKLMEVARDLASQGVAVLFISHRLDEITELCDRVTVFKDGAVTLDIPRDEVTRAALVHAIVGHAVVPGENKSQATGIQDRPVVLEVADIRRGRTLRGASLRLHQGELLGLAGLVGAGRTELARVIFGADQPDSGEMTLLGARYHPAGIGSAIASKVAYVPEERRSEGLFLNLSIEANIHTTTWRKQGLRSLPFLTSPSRSHAAARAMCQELGVVMRDGGTSQPVGNLSGGNQQKVLIGRWLATAPDVLILDEPTRGVDIGARAEIYSRIRDIADAGASVIVISSEFEELLECDRVLVIAEGANSGELVGDDIRVEEMLRLCYA